MSLLTAADVRALAHRLDLRPTKTLGQNFVIDPNTVRRLVRTAGVGVDDVVVEVGPGLGSLTLGLLEVATRVAVLKSGRKVADRATAGMSGDDLAHLVMTGQLPTGTLQ